jgi:hypothetical protein
MIKKAKKTTLLTVFLIWTAWFFYHSYDVAQDNHTCWRLGLLERNLFSAKYWFDHWRLKIDTYIMTQEQVSELFKNNPNSVPAHWDPKTGPTDQPLYAVIRVQNNTEPDLTGTLYCKLPTGERYLLEIHPPPHKNTFVNSVIPILQDPIKLKKTGTKIYTRWKYLYFN